LYYYLRLCFYHCKEQRLAGSQEGGVVAVTPVAGGTIISDGSNAAPVMSLSAHTGLQQLHIIPATGASDTDSTANVVLTASTAAAATAAAINVDGSGNTDTTATDNIAIEERTIRAAMDKQRQHNKASDATIAELRAEVAALNRKLNACLIVMIVTLAVAVATITGRTK
jgi:hypothetical protein